MKITLYSSKGSAGKTPIATNIALDREYAIGTNEPFHILGEVFPDDRVLSIAADESFPTFPDEIDIVFDLAGSISAHAHSITSAIEQSDLGTTTCQDGALLRVAPILPLMDSV